MKKIISMLLVMTALFSLVACQATPEDAIIVKKDTERMVEQASSPENGSLMDELAIPDGRYTFSASGLDGRLSIEVDAEIARPDADKMPIVRVAKGGFSQELVTNVFNYFFPDDKPHDVSGKVQSKAEIEKTIIGAKQRLLNGSYATDFGYTEEEYREFIAYLEQAYEDAPEAVPEAPVSDGTLAMTALEGAGDYLLLDVSTSKGASDTGDLSRTMSVSTPYSRQALESGFGSHLYYSLFSKSGALPDYNTAGIIRTDGTNLPQAAKDKLTVSYDEAVALCDGFFEGIGLSDEYRLGHAFLASDRETDGFGEAGKETSAQNYAYKLYYTRVIKSVPCFVNADWGLTDTEFSIPWSYECICFIVDNNGLVNLSWDNPVEVMETVQENAALKTFDEIMGIFEAMVKTEYEAVTNLSTEGSGKMDISIDAIQFCLVRVREQNAQNATGLLVPAWVFYGNNEITYGDGSVSYDLAHGSANAWNKEPFPILIINAIDGSVIDLAKGY